MVTLTLKPANNVTAGKIIKSAKEEVFIGDSIDQLQQKMSETQEINQFIEKMIAPESIDKRTEDKTTLLAEYQKAAMKANNTGKTCMDVKSAQIFWKQIQDENAELKNKIKELETQLAQVLDTLDEAKEASLTEVEAGELTPEAEFIEDVNMTALLTFQVSRPAKAKSQASAILNRLKVLGITKWSDLGSASLLDLVATYRVNDNIMARVLQTSIIKLINNTAPEVKINSIVEEMRYDENINAFILNSDHAALEAKIMGGADLSNAEFILLFQEYKDLFYSCLNDKQKTAIKLAFK